MNKKRVICVVSMLLGVLVILPSCSSNKAGSKSKEIVIGNIGAMTGSSAVIGNAQTQGVNLAVKEINAKGGIMGSQVKVITRDDEADATKSKTYMEEFVDKDKVNFVVGPTNSTPAAASMAYLQQNKIISIIPIATSNKLINKNNPYAFRLLPSNGMQAQALVKIAAGKKYKHIALVADNSALGTDGIAVMKASLEADGITPAAIISFQADQTDMSSVAQKIKDANADCALFWTLGADGAKIVRALDQLDYTKQVQIIGYTGLVMPNFKALAGPGASQTSVITIGKWALQPNKTQLDTKYWNMYQKINTAYGTYTSGKRTNNPDTVASGYDAVYLLKWAVEKAGTTDADAVKNVLETNIKEYDSVFVSKYNFTKESHEGYPITDLIQANIGDMAYGDIYKVYTAK